MLIFLSAVKQQPIPAICRIMSMFQSPFYPEFLFLSLVSGISLVTPLVSELITFRCLLLFCSWGGVADVLVFKFCFRMNIKSSCQWLRRKTLFLPRYIATLGYQLLGQRDACIEINTCYAAEVGLSTRISCLLKNRHLSTATYVLKILRIVNINIPGVQIWEYSLDTPLMGKKM